MKNLLSLTVATLFLLFALAQTAAIAQTTATATATTDPTQDPKTVTMAFFKVLKDADAATLVKIATNDFVIISSDGQQADRDLLSQALGGGFLTVQESPINTVTPRIYNGDAAVVVGNMRFKGDLQGQKFDMSVVFSATCVKDGTGWKIANLQLSPGQ
jgi:ketosteroid isomerase-like protein